MKTYALAALAALILAQPALADTDSSGNAAAGVALGSARAVAAAPATQKSDALEKASRTGNFKTFLSAIDAAGIEGDLGQLGPYTLFAPTDAAFAKLPAGAMDRLMQPENRDQLIALIRMHVVAGQALTADKMAGQQMTAETLNGPVAIDGTDPAAVWVNAVTVEGPGIRGKDGVVLAIDSLLLP